MESMKTPEQAICHLFFHCCKQDGIFENNEIDFVAAKFVELDMNRELDFKTEVMRYTEEHDKFPNDGVYIKSLIDSIKPVNTLALFSFCVEICLSDDLISVNELAFLDELASVMNLNEAQRDTIKAVVIERKVVMLNKII